MRSVGIEHVADRLIRNLSKGYRQRVGLGQALVGNPKALILDEPTIGLDPHQIIEMRDLVRTLGEQRTVILSSHILPEVSAVCERIIIISHGKIVASDTAENLARRSPAPAGCRSASRARRTPPRRRSGPWPASSRCG